MVEPPGDAWVALVSGIVSTKASVGYVHRAIQLWTWARQADALWSDTLYEEAFVCHDMGLRAAIEESFEDDSLHPALVGSLFFIIFNILQDDEQAIQSHAYHACRMIGELLADSEPACCVQDQLFWALTQVIHVLDVEMQDCVYLNPDAGTEGLWEATYANDPCGGCPVPLRHVPVRISEGQCLTRLSET
jgi:hypothetical protein